MSKLPTISGRNLAKFFKRHGFTEDRQTGSHIIMEKDGVARPAFATPP